ALRAVRDNGPGQHFLGSAHTLANFETAFYRSDTSDYNSFEQWSEEGAKDAATRANAIWKRMLAEYEAPPLDVATDEALMEFIIRRKASFPDSDVGCRWSRFAGPSAAPRHRRSPARSRTRSSR